MVQGLKLIITWNPQTHWVPIMLMQVTHGVTLTLVHVWWSPIHSGDHISTKKGEDDKIVMKGIFWFSPDSMITLYQDNELLCKPYGSVPVEVNGLVSPSLYSSVWLEHQINNNCILASLKQVVMCGSKSPLASDFKPPTIYQSVNATCTGSDI